MEEMVERREFVKSALATAGMASGTAFGQEPAETKQEFYQLRTYTLRSGPQLALAQTYFERALIPALSRLGMSPVGAFKLDIGPETPTYYVLIPSTSAEALISLDVHLGKDAEYVKAAAGFRDAPATAPAFVRTERVLLSAFSGWPKIVAPKHERRIFQLRTYESPSQVAHARKVQMFNEVEIGIFTRTGLMPVFFGDTLIGSRMPSLTYMLSFTDTAQLSERWAAFSADPQWKELSRRPGNTDAEIVSNISNLYLSPLSCSQI
jgi:hypothetical protein